MTRRSKLEIIYDILKAIEEKGGAIKPTHLLYKSNLSHVKMKEYITELSGKEMLTETADPKVYVLTDTGRKFIVQYKQMKEFSESFGL